MDKEQTPKKWTRTDTRNEYITKFNILVYETGIILQRIEKITNEVFEPKKDISLLLRNKFYSIEEEFKKSGIDIYSNDESTITKEIFSRLLDIYEKSINLLNRVASMLAVSSKFNGGELISYPFLKVSIKAYDKLCDEMNNYDVIKDLENILRNKYESTEYYIYTPGTYIGMLEEDTQFVSKLLDEQIANSIKQKFLPLIEKQEQATRHFQIETANLAELNLEEIDLQMQEINKDSEKIKEEYNGLREEIIEEYREIGDEIIMPSIEDYTSDDVKRIY